MFDKKFDKKLVLPNPNDALPGRNQKISVSTTHFVNQNTITAPFPDNTEQALFGLGCFWGAERKYWQTGGVYSTAVGYAAGYTPNPSYEEVCSGQTGHNEVVLVIYEPNTVTFDQLLIIFWQGHNPTQGMQQGNDRGTQYRSGIYTFNAHQKQSTETSLARYQSVLDKKITTEIIDAPKFYYAEDYHQQYLAKNPSGYCGLGGLNISYPND